MSRKPYSFWQCKQNFKLFKLHVRRLGLSNWITLSVGSDGHILILLNWDGSGLSTRSGFCCRAGAVPLVLTSDSFVDLEWFCLKTRS